MKNKKIKFLISVLISVVFLVVVFRKVNFKEILNIIFSINLYYISFAIFACAFSLVVRSYRWKVLLNQTKPDHNIPVKSFFEATCVGQMTNNILPFRIGDFAQAYFLSYKENMSKSITLSTVVVERLVDLLMPILILIFGSFFVFLPEEISRNKIFFIVFVLLAIMVLFFRFQLKLQLFLRKIFPSGTFGEKIHKFIEHLYTGIAFIKDKKALVKIFTLTVLLWSVYALVVYLCVLAFDIPIGCFDSFLVLSIAAIGVAIPSSPGYIGTWEFFCVLALSIFKIEKNLALSFAVVYHFINWILVTLLGFIVLLKSGVSLNKLGQSVPTHNTSERVVDQVGQPKG